MAKRSLRWSEQVCVLEGPDLIDAALEAGVEFEGVYVEATAQVHFSRTLQRAHDLGVRVFSLESGVIEKIADAKTPQPILAAVRFRTPQLGDVEGIGTVIALHDLRDPGNVGTIIRSADASGASAVVLTGSSVDPYNPKTLRATAGSIFHLPVILHPALDDVVAWFRASGGRSYATVVRGGVSLDDVALPGTQLFILGNEAEGLDEASANAADERLTIPMSGRAESLNVSIAAALVLFAGQRARQRDK